MVRREVSGGPVLWIAVEQWPAVNAAVSLLDTDAAGDRCPKSLRREVTVDEARMLLVRGRLEISGPTTAERIAAELGMELNRCADRARTTRTGRRRSAWAIYECHVG